MIEKYEYLFQFSFHVPRLVVEKHGPPGSGSKITLTYDKASFASEPERTLAVESRYDTEQWLVAPATTERTIGRELTLKTHLRISDQETISPLDLTFTIPIAIHQDWLRRARFVVVGIFGDIALAASALVLAVGKAPATSSGQPPPGTIGGFYPDAIVFVAIGSALAAVFKALAGFWKP